LEDHAWLLDLEGYLATCVLDVADADGCCDAAEDSARFPEKNVYSQGDMRLQDIPNVAIW